MSERTDALHQSDIAALGNIHDALITRILSPEPISDSDGFNGSELIAYVTHVRSNQGLEVARAVSAPVLSGITKALFTPDIDESHLATINRTHYGNLTYTESVRNEITRTIAGIVRTLGYYTETAELVAEAARHTGLPVEDLTSIITELHKSEQVFEDAGELSNKDAAVLLLEAIAEGQTYLPDSKEKIDRVIVVALVASDLLVTESIAMNAGHGNELRCTMLERALFAMGASIEDPRMQNALATAISEKIDVDSAYLTYVMKDQTMRLLEGTAIPGE